MLASICVGLFGPRRSGKSTLLKALLDNESDPTSEATVETRGLRFAHAEIHECNGGSCSSGEPYYYHRSFGNMLLDDYTHETVDDNEIISRRAVSFVDCPGHMGSIPTMLKGMMMSDAELILSRPKADASFSDPPTLEVLAAADLMGKPILVVQSRADTASDRLLEKHRAEIRLLTHDIIHKHVPIVEAKAVDRSSVAGLCERMLDMMRVTTVTERNTLGDEALLLVGASCVVNGPVTVEEVEAAAAAADAGDATIFVTIYGRLVQGIVSPGDEVEVRPGVTVLGEDRKVVCHPIILKVSSVVAAADQQEPPAAGGGVLLALRATATVANVAAGRDGDGDGDGSSRQQQLVRSVLAGDGGLEGHVLGHVGSLPGVYGVLQMKFWPVSKMFDPYAEEMRRVNAIELNQELLLIIGTMSTYGKVRKLDEVTEEEEEDAGGESSRGGGGGAAKAKAKAKAKKKKKNYNKSVMVMVVGGLSPPTCARPGENILICRRLERSWHLIGRGQIIGGVSAAVSYAQY